MSYLSMKLKFGKCLGQDYEYPLVTDVRDKDVKTDQSPSLSVIAASSCREVLVGKFSTALGLFENKLNIYKLHEVEIKCFSGQDAVNLRLGNDRSYRLEGAVFHGEELPDGSKLAVTPQLIWELCRLDAVITGNTVRVCLPKNYNIGIKRGAYWSISNMSLLLLAIREAREGDTVLTLADRVLRNPSVLVGEPMAKILTAVYMLSDPNFSLSTLFWQREHKSVSSGVSSAMLHGKYPVKVLESHFGYTLHRLILQYPYLFGFLLSKAESINDIGMSMHPALEAMLIGVMRYRVSGRITPVIPKYHINSASLAGELLNDSPIEWKED